MADPAQRHSSSERDAAALLAVVEGLAAESRPGIEVCASFDSFLERDLGLDSLSRVELLSRVEREFGIRLPSEVLASAETVRDLHRAVLAADRGAPGYLAAPRAEAPPERAQGVPAAAHTLVEALAWHVRAHPERLHVLFYRTAQQQERMSYAGLWARAQAVSAALSSRGLERGQSVAIMLPTCLEFFHCYYGILMAGGVPVPLYPPARLSQLEDHLRRQAGILDSCLAPVLITVP